MTDKEFDAMIAKLRKKSDTAHAKLDKRRASKLFDDEFTRLSNAAFDADNKLSSLMQKRAREKG